jgi:hypothetical protein
MADTTVTGKIGDQEVALINAASEATLQKLLESFEKMRTGGGSSSGGGAGGGAGASGQQSQVKATTATATAMNAAGQAVGKFGKAIGEATGKLITFAGQLIGGTLRSVTNIAKELFSGGERVSDFTKHLAELPSVFGMVGSAIHMFSSFIDKNIDIQRQLSQVGGSFGGSITEMRKAAAQSGLGLDRFSKLVLENSTTMSLFGSTVTQGAIRMGQMSKQLREGQVGKQLMSMGFTIDELNETLIAYANINSRMGHDRARTDMELIDRAGKFGQELNRAAIASGLSRSQLTKTVDTMSKDMKIQSLLKDLPAELKDKVLLSLSKLTTEFDGAADALLDLADGLPQGDEAKALANFAPGMGKIMEDLKNGVIDENTARNRMIAEAQISAENIKDMGQDVITQIDQSMPGFSKMRDAILKMASSTQKSAEQIDIENKKAAAADEKANAVEKFYKSFSDVIVRFRALIEDKILNSEIFQDLEKYLQNFVGSNEGSFSNILDQIATAFSDFLFSLHLFIQDVTKVGFGQAIKTRFEAFIKDLFNIKDSDMKGKDGAPDKTIMEVIIGKAISSIGSAIMDGIKSFFKDNSLIAIVGAGIVGLFVAAKIADSIKSLFGMGGGKAAGPASPGGAVSGGGALASLGGDLAKAAGWLAKGAAIGASMFAIGLGVEKLAEGLSGFQDLDWETIGKGVTAIGAFGLAAGIMGEFIVPIGLGAAAIGALGLAVSMFPADRLKILGDILQTAFNGISQIIDSVGTAVTKPLTAIGTLMEKITAMRTAVIEATTQQIQTLSQIPSDKMLSAAAGIDAIKKALDGFSPGFLSGLSSGLGSIFAADEASVLNKMANLGPKLGEAANGYTAFKTAIAGMNLANLTMTSEQTDSFVTLTNNLPKFTATMTNLGAQASNISAAATAIGAFRTATEGFDLKDFTFSKEQLTSLADGTTKLRALSEQLTSAKDGFQKLDNQGLTKIKDGVESLSKAFKDFNESFIDKFIPKLDALKSKTQEGLMTDLGTKLDTLNSNVTSLISIESDSKKYLDTIASKRPGVVSGGRG